MRIIMKKLFWLPLFVCLAWPAFAQVTAFKTVILLSDSDTNNKASPGDTLRYTIVITNTSGSNLLNVVLSDTNFPYQTLVVGSIKSLPIARPDAYTAIGNTLLNASAPGVLANDSDPDGDLVSAIAGTFATTGSGSVTVTNNGGFTYISAAGFTGTDTFTYTISDGNGGTSSSTVTINVSSPVWYVNNAGANGDGRQTSPFNSLSPVNGVSFVNDYIYLFQGSGDYTAGITLKNGQQLVGSGDALIVNGTTIYPASARPTILATTGTGGSLGTDNIVHGLDIGSANGRAISGATVGNVVISNVTASATGGAVVNLGSGTVNVTLDSAASTNSADNGIALIGINGIFVANGGFISGAAGTDFLVSGGNGTITCPGGIANTAGRSLDISGKTGGTVTLSGSITDTGTGIVLLNNTNTAIHFSGSSKVINTGANTAVAMTNNTGSTIDFINNGLVINTTAGNGFVVVGGGTVTVNGTGNSIATGAGTTFLNSGTGGSATIDLNAPLTGTGRLIDIQNRASGTVTLSGNLNDTGGTGILLQNNTGGTTTFSGASKLLDTGANPAVSLTNNNGHTINFSNGGLAITTTSGAGFTATSGATAVNVTGAGNTIDARNGIGLNVANTTIGASGLTFQRISSGPAANDGIFLDTIGANGGLTITGTGVANSGGVISGKTGADGSTTSGIGIYLNSASSISLAYMDIEGNQNYGIRGNNVTGFTLDNSTVGTTSVNGTSNTADNDPTGYNGEGSVRFYNLLGSATIRNSTLDQGFAKTIAIANDTGTLDRLTLSNCAVKQSLTAPTASDSFYAQSSSSATLNLTINGASQFTATHQFHVDTSAQGASTMDIQINGGCVFANSIDPVPAGGGLQFGGSGTDSLVTFNITGNSFRHGTGASSPGINNVGRLLTCGMVSGNGKFDGKILTNTFGVSGIVRSGSGDGADAIGIFASGNQAGTTRVTGTKDSRFLVQGNTIKRYGETGIQINARQGNSILDATAIGNTVNEPGTAALGAFGAIWVNAGALGGDSSTVNIAIGDKNVAANKNTIQDSDPSNSTDVFLDSGSCSSCPSHLNLYKNNSTSTTAQGVIVDDNNPTLDLVGFTGGTITLVNGLPPLPQ